MANINHEKAKINQVNRAITFIFVPNVFACLVFLYQFGFTYSTTRPLIQYAVTGVFFLVFLIRQRLSFNTKLIFLIIYGLITTTAGLLYVGTMTVSLSLFTIIVVIGALYYNKRQLYLLLFSITCILSITGYAYIQGGLKPTIKPDILISQPVYWVSFIVLMIACFAIICNAILSYRQRIDKLHTTIEQQNQQLLTLAYTDPLTNLASSRMVDERLTATLDHCKRYKTKAAILFIDIDNFKTINDTFGHSMGDTCLKKLAQRLISVARESDMVARIGGDEFLIIIEKISITDELDDLLQSLLDAIRQPMVFDSATIKITCSIGVAIIPQLGKSSAQLKCLADKAMYQAKRYGKDQFFLEQLIDVQDYY